MNRRDFFRAAPAVTAVPLLAVAGVKDAKPGFIERPILQFLQTRIAADLSRVAIEDGIGAIIKTSGYVPDAYLVRCGPYLYEYAKDVIVELNKAGHTTIELRCEPGITDEGEWSIEANGVLYWSPGT